MPLEALKTGWWRRYCRWEILPFLVWLVMFIGVLFAPMPLYNGEFNHDSDNYMRADQVRDWLDGSHGWYDTRHRRLDPPNGADVYSRLIDLPLAGIALLAKPYVGLERGILVAGFIVPFFLQLPLLLWLLGWAYRPLFGQASWLMAPIGLAYPGIMTEFIPGRIDHHSYQIMLTILTFGAMLRLWQADETTSLRALRAYGLVLGLALAVSLTIGVEALPWLGIFLAMVGYKVWQAPRLLRPAAIAFAISAPLASALLLVAFRTPAQFMQPTLNIMSLVSVKIALAAGLTAALAAFVAPRIADDKQRAFTLLGMAAGLGGLLLLDTPGLLKGPWLGFDPWLIAFTSNRVNEMKPIAWFADIWPWVEALAFIALAGYWSAFCTITPGSNSSRRLLLALLFVLSAVLAVLSVFFVARLNRFWFIVSAPGWFYALLYLKEQGLGLIKRHPRLVVLLSLLLAAAPPLILLVQAIMPAALPNAIAADDEEEGNNCSLCLAADFLNAAYPTPQRILVYNAVGPELVWRTRHIYFGGGIYNNPDGLRLSRNFFITSSPRTAARMLSASAIDLVFVQEQAKAANSFRNQTDDTFDLPLHADDPNAMIQRLNRGETFPWLVERDVPFNEKKKFTIYEVDKAALVDAVR